MVLKRSLARVRRMLYRGLAQQEVNVEVRIVSPTSFPGTYLEMIDVSDDDFLAVAHVVDKIAHLV